MAYETESVSETRWSDAVVRDFYGASGGAKMFDNALLTEDLAKYLTSESRALARLFAEPGGPAHLVEVGCGLGTYRAWALERGVAYDGLDLVPWLVQAGEGKAQPNPGSLRSKLHVCSCEDIAGLFSREGLDAGHAPCLILFPFNCFGNLGRPEAAARGCGRTGARVFVSTYALNRTATHVRLTYYAACGYTGMSAEPTPYGNLIASREGLRSRALSRMYLETTFGRVGYRLTCIERLGSIGVGFHFAPEAAASGAQHGPGEPTVPPAVPGRQA